MKRKAPLFSRPGKRLTQSDSGSVLIYTVIASLIVASLSITYFSSTMKI